MTEIMVLEKDGTSSSMRPQKAAMQIRKYTESFQAF